MRVKQLLSFTLFFLALTFELTAQVNVSGAIRDAETGDPLIGATIAVKGTTIGTITDIDGKFNLNVDGSGSTLVLSFIGFTTLEVPVGDRSIFDLTLLPFFPNLF